MTTQLGPANSSFTIQTSRSGMAAKVGHDLVIEVTAWSATLDLDGDAPSLTASIDATSLQVREGRGGAKPLSDKDRSDIRKNIADKILHTARNPTMAFQSTTVRRSDDQHLLIDGRLTLAGVTVPVEIPVVVDRQGDEIRLSAATTIVQTQFGIKPFTTMMGALKVADPVEARIEVRLPAADWPE